MGIVGEKDLSLWLSASGTRLRVVHEEACPELGPICAVRDEPPQVHDQSLSAGELRLDAEYGFLSGWSAELLLGLKVVDTRVAYRDLQGNPKTLDYEDIHHRDQTVWGPSDGQLWLRRGLGLDKLALSFRVGVTLPLGATAADPFYLGAVGEAHQHVQLGTGTFNVLFGAEARREFQLPFRGSFGGYLQGQWTPYTSPRGYRAGPRALAELYLAGKLGFSGPSVRAGVLGIAEGAEHWDSTPNAHEGNLGRTDVLAELSAIWSLGEDWTASLSVRLPVWGRAAGEQLTYSPLAELGAGKLLHLHEGEEGGGGEE